MKIKRLFLKILGVSFAISWAMGTELPTPLALPQRIYGLQGEACVVRFENLIFVPIKNSVLFDVDGEGVQYSDRLVWWVKDKDVAPFQLRVFSGQTFEKLGEASSEFVCCNPAEVTSQGSIRWLAIGDSLTFPGYYLEQTIATIAEKLPGISLLTVGTQHPRENTSLNHEGRGGWTWRHYLEASAPASQFQSPFVFGNGGEKDFDFKRYIRENMAGTAPEIITILLGCNDVYGISADFSPEKVDAIVERASRMVEKIRKDAPDSVIGIIIPPPPSEQNGFGANYKTGVTEWQYRRALQYYIAALLQTFDGRWEERIYVIPGYLAFDAANSYPGQPQSSQNALHPTAKGFEPISFSLSSWIIHLLSTNTISPK